MIKLTQTLISGLVAKIFLVAAAPLLLLSGRGSIFAGSATIFTDATGSAGLNTTRFPFGNPICRDFDTDGELPNIIVILADDLGYGDVGFNGCPDIPTPNIDSLTTNGVLCTNGYVTHPLCSPSRASLISGRYQQRFGYENQPLNDASNPRLGLPMQELLLPQLLKPRGYVCGAIGKWHLGYALNFHPIQRGFDEFFGFLGGDSEYFNARILRGETPVVEPEYLTDAFTREAVSFIDRYATQPFFLYLAYNAPHQPHETTQAYLDRVPNISDPQRRKYAAMVVALDDGVGQVLQTLQANNILNNTLIIFLSDNGAPHLADTVNSNAPLRGYKSNMLEGGIRVPFAVQWTDRLPANVVYDDMVSSLDIVPSAATAAGVSLPTDRAYDGLDIIPYLAGEQVSPERTLFWRWFGLGPDGPLGALNAIWAVRSGPLKLVVERAKDDQPPALYDVLSDIAETQDLAAIQPEDVDSLTQLFAQWSAETIPPLWQERSIFDGGPLVLVGDWNEFNKDDSSPPWGVKRISAPGVDGTPDGFNWFTTTVHAATTGGDTTPGEHSFALVRAGTYSKQWGGVAININDATTIPFFSGDVLGPTNSISFEDGFYYSFRILDPQLLTPLDLKLAVMKTSAPPVSVSRIGQTPTVPTPDDPITVSIATSQAKSLEERIYVRWSTDLFITSQLIEAEGSGVSYSATIPQQPSGTVGRWYTIVTSTADLTPYSTSGVIDALILATTGVFTAVPTGPLTLISAASRLTHSTAGTFDVDMPLTGTSGVEGRSATTYNAVFTFSNPVTSGQVSVLSGAATVGAISFSGNSMTAQITGITAAETVLLRVEDINGDGMQHGDVSFGFLAGDVDAHRTVGRADQTAVRSQLNQPVTSANFRDDLNADGTITRADVRIVNANRDHVLP